MRQQIGQESAQILAMPCEFVQLAQGSLSVAGQDCVSKRKYLFLCREPEHRENVIFNDAAATETDQLIEGGFGISHSAVGPASNGMQGRFVDLHLFQPGDLLKVLDDQGNRYASKVKALAAGKDRRQDLLWLGRCKHELYVGRRLFQRFQKRVERLFRQHVNFVDNVDLKP